MIADINLDSTLTYIEQAALYWKPTPSDTLPTPSNPSSTPFNPSSKPSDPGI